MAETLGILLLCVSCLVCVVLPCLAVVSFMVWVLTNPA